MNGHTVTYDGTGAMAFRLDAAGNLIAFAGTGATSLSVNGKTWTLAQAPGMHFGWALVPESRRVAGGAVFQLISYSGGTLQLPKPGLPAGLQLMLEGATPGSSGESVAVTDVREYLNLESKARADGPTAWHAKHFRNGLTTWAPLLTRV